MNKLLLAAAAATLVFTPMAANAGQFCASSRWVNMGGERVKVCCNSRGFCTTKYGVYQK